MPKVSVIIPVYNTEKYLRKCLESVCSQTLRDIEIICVNDCSTDNSLNILKEYPVKIINLEENQGVSYARNRGIEASSGEYLGFIDADDFIDLDFYEKLYNKAAETNADCAKGNVYDFNPETGNSHLSDFYDINNKIKANKANFCFAFTSGIYKTSLIKENNICFPEHISHFEDPYFSIKFSIIVKTIEIVNDAIYYYTKHDNSACHKSNNILSAQHFIQNVKSIMDCINEYDTSLDAYLIYTDFLLNQVVPWCGKGFSNDINRVATDGLLYIINNSKYPQADVLSNYFIEKKKTEQKKLFNELRNRKKLQLCQKSR